MKRKISFLLVLLAAASTFGQRIGPLLQAPWGQDAPFNTHCPLYDDASPVKVGCVATAMSQIMYYYQYPECTCDTLFGWTDEHFVTDTIMPGAVIDWDNILYDYRGSYTDQEADAIGWLSYYLGIASRMNYGKNSSGADAGWFVSELPRVFGYRSCVECDRAFYTQDGWRRLLVNELENGRPVYYTAHNMEMAGHAFVIDGYDYATGRFHTNLGYDGNHNMWVDIDAISEFENPDDTTLWGQRNELHCNHYALLVHPFDDIVPAADSIEWKDGDVTVDAIHVLSTPARTNGYEQLDITLTSHRSDTIHYTFELLSNAPGDTAIFRQADYVALGGVVLYPGETTVFRTAATFTVSGERILRLSNDDVSLYCPTAVTVEKGASMKLSFSDLRMVNLSPTSATLAVDIECLNSGTAGSIVQYYLYPSGSEDYLSHRQMITDSDPVTLTDTVTFKYLEPDADYTVKVLWPWNIRQEYSFHTPDKATQAVERSESAEREWQYYDLSGRRLPGRPNRGLYLRR